MSLQETQILRFLKETGIIEQRVKVTTFEQSSNILAPGDLSAGRPLNSLAVNKPLTRAPSVFWKAIGFSFKNIFTVSGSLYDDDQALFLGAPGQLGIPEGSSFPQEVTNYQIFVKADTIQRVNRPAFNSSGSSYFEFLNLFMKHVGGEDESKELSEAREALLNAKARKDNAWNAQKLKMNQLQANPTERHTSLINYMHHNKPYILAWEEESAAEDRLVSVQNPRFKSAAGQLDLLRLADMRLEPQEGNNMPVITVDADWIQLLKQNPGRLNTDIVNPKNVYYRPEYRLSNYELIVDYWLLGASNTMQRDGPYEIPLANIWKRQWSDLGHPLLDDDALADRLTEEQKSFINTLSATITFLQKPYSNNVSRGIWDIAEPRSRFPLHPNAPDSIKAPICKTSRLLLCWGFEIELTIPGVMVFSPDTNITLSALDLPLKRLGETGNKMIFSAGGDGFPILLGAIADII